MLGLLRYQIFLAYGLAFLAMWQAATHNREAIADKLEFVGIQKTHANLFVTFLPLLAIAALGIYGILSIGYGVATFADCPKAAADINREVKEARVALRKKGMT